MKSNEFIKGMKFTFKDTIQYAENAIVSKHILKNANGNVSLFAFSKNEGLSEHTAPFDAMVQVVDGEAEIIIDGKSTVLVSGESIIMPANISHAIRATEDFKMILTMIKNK